MQPDDLAFAVHVELVVVAGPAVDFMYVPDVWLALPQRIRKAGVKIGGEHGTDEAAQHEVGKHLVTGADAVDGPHQIEEHTLAEFGGHEQMLDHERKILGQADGSGKNPFKTLQPGFPFRWLHALRWPRVFQLAFRIHEPSYLLHRVRGSGDARTEGGSCPKENERTWLIRGPQQRPDYRHGFFVAGHLRHVTS